MKFTMNFHSNTRYFMEERIATINVYNHIIRNYLFYLYMICFDFSPLASANVAGARILASLGKNLNKSR